MRTSVWPSLRNGEKGYLVRWQTQRPHLRKDSAWFVDKDEAETFRRCLMAGGTVDDGYRAIFHGVTFRARTQSSVWPWVGAAFGIGVLIACREKQKAARQRRKGGV